MSRSAYGVSRGSPTAVGRSEPAHAGGVTFFLPETCICKFLASAGLSVGPGNPQT